MTLSALFRNLGPSALLPRGPQPHQLHTAVLITALEGVQVLQVPTATAIAAAVCGAVAVAFRGCELRAGGLDDVAGGALGLEVNLNLKQVVGVVHVVRNSLQRPAQVGDVVDVTVHVHIAAPRDLLLTLNHGNDSSRSGSFFLVSSTAIAILEGGGAKRMKRVFSSSGSLASLRVAKLMVTHVLVAAPMRWPVLTSVTTQSLRAASLPSSQK
eukprot:CAMPEP_0202912892 /NCGR_PEP_ID=MMETSP1392-20130828/58975_1 /ASSEMBLY_ACC=CAM_ASM_000868 /TAXON_ID=225041 /ORGANISM="Chlamydomonas chlamydogama, Strain SAG 11-48b" /LENGTH=211 /DNA_ID=CAMNT_0049603971 /DNA_START=389 /DNA_END=1025 /DNA_ORIENTATION=-